jgi:uncharacterized protein (DUF4415 family)
LRNWERSQRLTKFRLIEGKSKTQAIPAMISMWLDADVVAWLKKRGKGYQTQVNSILRQTMLTDIKRT